MAEEKKDDPDAIAKRLRDKIREQAASLLDRVDDAAKSRRATPTTTPTAIEGETLPSNSSSASISTSSTTATTISSSTNGSTNGSANVPKTTTTTTGTLEPSTTNNNNSSGGGGGVGSAPSSSDFDLTKRLQQLALQRDNDNKLCSNTRLKVIQDDSRSTHLSSSVNVRSFADLKLLPDHLLKAVYEMGFDRPSAIQEAALPILWQGRNLIGQAQSGSGKTAAFCLGMLRTLDTSVPFLQSVCVTPTRELAIQIVQNAAIPLSARCDPPMRLCAAVAQTSDIPDPVNPPHLIVGTPGKLCHWLKKKYVTTEHVNVFCLDEADQMVAAGSGHRANSLLIHKQMPPTCQCILMSATFPKEVVQFATKLCPKADRILMGRPEHLVLDVIKQVWIDTRTYSGGKLVFLADIYSLLTIGQSIIFVETRAQADAVHSTLCQSGYTCGLLTGAVEAADRDSAMDDFRRGVTNVLIATNVLARGVDVDNVCLVVNYNVPVLEDKEPDFETYLHRIGRTGRFGRKGTAISLIGDEESLLALAKIEKHFSKGDGTELIHTVPADPEALAEMIEI